MIKEFVTFLKQNGVIGLAIAVIIGGKLNLIITSIVNDLLAPLIFLPALKAAGVDNISSLSYNGILYGKVFSSFGRELANFLKKAWINCVDIDFYFWV